ncbi:hypothetical protein B9Z55_018046 [Caenorhabditis nigoni]|uniref:Uncharacterized protein n=1 Tax=Caenorhabditis nigoni TaxID=1611254 RepID=A0A2G5TCH5_9PELO|nr:hypothetical protein B9Z55_018046 [Caenorhabditis nigoni]
MSIERVCLDPNPPSSSSACESTRAHIKLLQSFRVSGADLSATQPSAPRVRALKPSTMPMTRSTRTIVPIRLFSILETELMSLSRSEHLIPWLFDHCIFNKMYFCIVTFFLSLVFVPRRKDLLSPDLIFLEQI